MRKLSFIGAGRMGAAMVHGLLARKYFVPADIICLSAADGTGESLARQTGIGLAKNYDELLRESSIVILAVKPQQLREIATGVAIRCDDKLVLSILAGTTLARLRECLPSARNIVRAMPNTPGQIGAGITAYATDTPLDPAEKMAVEKILGALGVVLALPEAELDAVTAVSGSGPAYLFEFVAALREAALAAGLSPETARLLAIHTVLGSAKLVEASPETPETLRNWVTSPGGTTQAGLQVMEARGFRDTIRDTVLAAKRRSIELSAL